MTSSNRIESNDPFMPLVGNYFYQNSMKQSWVPTTAEELNELLSSSHPPETRTVLGITREIFADMPTADLPYIGAMYFDFDAENIDEAITYFNEFTLRLLDMAAPLDSIRFFATGGRGFHIEVPMQLLMERVPAEGVKNLPLIYKQIARALYVETLDLRIYSEGKGRAWRVPNRIRENGQFKVPLTVSEVMAINCELYASLVSAPRAFPLLATPKFCPEFGLIYAQANAIVNAKIVTKPKRKHAPSTEESAFKSRFKSSLPPSLAALCHGRIPARGGWNQIVIQIGLAALAVGMTEDATVDACKGLISAHESDSHRYNSPRKRETALRNMYDYLDRSPNYSVSVAGIRSILPQGLPCFDFRGL